MYCHIERRCSGLKNFMKQSCSGYFTVEAALVMPIVIGCILFVIYMWFFQYDRCLMETDINAAALRAASAETDSLDERLELAEKYVQNISTEKYAAWDKEDASIKIEKNKVCIEAGGNVRFPIRSLIFQNDGNVWSASVQVKTDVINPAFVVRSINKTMGIGKEWRNNGD
jgi:Flp pilus assembly protein TadG